jgi:hypothetical protein
MKSRWAWAGYVLFALCLLGSVAWPLWSDNDLWMLSFAALGAIVIFPVIFWPVTRSLTSLFEGRPRGR